jgi:hypothetical protein
MLNITVLSVLMLNVTMVSVLMLSVTMVSVILENVVMLNFFMLMSLTFLAFTSIIIFARVRDVRCIDRYRFQYRYHFGAVSLGLMALNIMTLRVLTLLK